MKSRATAMPRCFKTVAKMILSVLWLPSMAGVQAGTFENEPSPVSLNFNPGAEYAGADREFQGVPGIARAPGGRLWASWFGGGKDEGTENYILLATSGDDGQTWSDPKVVIDPPFRASEPGVWTDPRGRLWFFWNHYPNGLCEEGSSLWAVTAENPDAENPDWSPPRLLAREMNCFNKPVVLESGLWLWPAANWWIKRDDTHLSRPLLSSDEGSTFKPGGPVSVPPMVRQYDEYNVVQLRDKRLWLLTRTKAGPYESFSNDEGQTWSPLLSVPGIQHAASRHFLTRLRSGNLLLVKHGPVDRDVDRSQLMAFVSCDEGRTWQGGLMLDERNGVSYPDGDQAGDGAIYVIYDYERYREARILLARFTEEDVLAGRIVSDRAALRLIVNDAGGQKPEKLRDNSDGEPLRTEPAGRLSISGVSVKPFAAGQTLFEANPAALELDGSHTLAECPAPLAKACFLKTTMAGVKRARCSRAGMVYFLTPQPDRHQQSQSKHLLEQGFSMVALPETELFRHGRLTGAYCTLYQKHCAEGETVEFGKWAVPLFFP